MHDNTTSAQEHNTNLRKERNQMRNKLQDEKHQHLLENITEIERNRRNDSTRMYKAVEAIQLTGNKSLYIRDEGFTADPKRQSKIVTEDFQTIFNGEKAEKLSEILPTHMIMPFRKTEIKRATKSLKQLKYGAT